MAKIVAKRLERAELVVMMWPARSPKGLRAHEF
jgi:hypothetical protein